MTGRARLNEVTVRGKRHYELASGELVPSVTTFLGVLPKEALDRWKLKTVSQWAVKYQDSWSGLPEEAAVDLIKNSAWYDTSARDAGDIAHKILEDRALGKTPFIPPGFEGASRCWDEFTAEFDVEVLHVEPQLVNNQLKYSGSADLIAKVNGETALIDHKSGNGLYGSTAYQLAAYAMADELIPPNGDPIPMPEVTRLYGLWVRPDGWALYPMEFSDDTWNVVRAARALYDLTKNDWNYRGKPINEGALKKAVQQWGDSGGSAG